MGTPRTKLKDRILPPYTRGEEAANMIKFQNAYNLSSKMISVLCEVYDKLIQETGV